MILNIKIKFYELILFFLSFLFFLIYFSDFRKEFNQRVVVLFPKIPVIFFENDNFNFAISNSNETFTPVFFDTPRFAEIDSRIAKRFDNCDNARVYNYKMSPTMLTFTIDSDKKEKILECYTNINLQMKKKWEDAKGSEIKFIDQSHLLISSFSKNLAKKVLEPINYILENFETINCEKYFKFFFNKTEILDDFIEAYLEVCGDKLKLNFSKSVSILDKNDLVLLNSIFRNYLDKEKITKFEFKDNNFYFPTFFKNKNKNKNKISESKSSFVLNKDINKIMNESNKIFKNDVQLYWTESNNDKNFNKTFQYPKKFVQLSYMKSIVNTILSKDLDNQRYSFKQFENSELKFLKSEIYELGSSRKFSTFGIYFTSLFFALAVILIKKFLVVIIKYKLNEKK